jgi:DNA polymerase elongation subunit (family B)
MDRKAFQKRLAELEAKKAQIKAKGTLTEEDEKQLKEITEEAGYCDRIQYIKKIQLNSMYGALGNRFFKFFDVRLAESTTRTGREVLLHMCKKTAELLDGEYTLPSESVIYGDTDSCYFKTHAPDRETAQKITKIVEKKVNESFPQFLRENFLTIKGYDHLVECGYEFISDRGIFVKPKMYILHLVEKKNREVDDMKVMGVQLKKTTIPKPISKQLTKYIETLLKGKPWKEIGKDLVEYKDVLLKTENIMNIGLPKGVNNMEDYVAKYEANEPDLKIPGHVAAAIFWNSCLDDFKDKESIKITSGTKIKVFYLKTKYGRFKSIAVPTDTRELPGWFKKHFEKDIDREAQVKRLIDQTLKNIVGAIGETIPTKKSLLVDELFEY